MTIPKVYRKSREQTIASYDAVDLAEGTGTVKYYFALNENSTGQDHILTRDYTIYSKLIETPFNPPGTSFTKEVDLDFDLSAFNLPSTLRGTAIFQMAAKQTNNAAGNSTEMYLIVKVRKWDGATETEIASGQTETFITPAETVSTTIFNLPIVIPRTGYKKGEVLRVTVEAWTRQVNAGGSASWLGHDPRNRDGDGIIPSTDDPVTFTNSHILIPYEII